MSDPVLSAALANAWRDKGRKPTARGTLVRYSSAGDCARKMAYLNLAEESDPMDEADVWAPGIGDLTHTALQEAIGAIYRTAQFEVPSMCARASGSMDVLVESAEILETTGIDLGGTHVELEIKSMGQYAFDKAVGWDRMRSALKRPEGPKHGHVVQAGMNALGVERENVGWHIETILLGYLCVSALSVRSARRMGLAGFDRFGVEFRLARHEWCPPTIAEIDRMTGIADAIDRGYLPERIALNDHGEQVEITPGRDWNCDYCAFRSLCEQDGTGTVYIMDSVASNG